jgi:cytochrome c
VKHLVFVALFLLPSLLQAGGNASAMGSAQGCYDCHSVDKEKYGPTFQAVAARYRGDSEAPAMLAKNIKYGIRGKWGNLRHPPQMVSEKKAMKLAVWILGMKEEPAKPSDQSGEK